MNQFYQSNLDDHQENSVYILLSLCHIIQSGSIKLNLNTMEIKYSELSKRTKSSEIRELLKYTRIKDIISFAGGLPDPSLFPIKDVTRITEEVLQEKGFLALQYGPTIGEPDFIDAIREHTNQYGEEIENDQICVTSSSQQGLDLISLVMLDPGDEIILELPSYLGAIQAFERTGVIMNGIPLQNDGMDIEILSNIIKKKLSVGKKIKFIYTIPDYQNPSGITMSKEKRLKLIEIADKYSIPIIEDSPYRELCYNNSKVPSLWALTNSKGIIQLKTLSKMLFPGMRIGWIAAEKEIVNKFSLMKQSVDLCSPTINQLIIAQYVREGLMKATIERAIALYQEKIACMLNALKKYMPEYVTWSKPTGGVFLWIKLPDYMDSKELIKKAAENKVIFVTGKPFHCDGSGKNTLRLNYSFPTIEQINTGIFRLTETIKEFQKLNKELIY